MKKYNAPTALNLVSSPRTPLLSGALLAGLMFALTPYAYAGTIGIGNGTLIVGTEIGDGNQNIALSIDGSDLLVSAANFDLVTPGCSLTDPGTFACAIAGFSQLVVLGGDGDDIVDLSRITSVPPFGVTLLGGAGADVLIGSAGDDTIFGGPGDDVLIGGPGVDCLNGGTGSNVVFQSGCGGADPIITPLPRPDAVTPEPGGLFLLAAGLAVLPLTARRKIS